MSDNLLAPIASLVVPEAGALLARAESSLEAARLIVIDGQPMYEIAAGELKDVKRAAARLDADRRKLVDPLNTVVKEINARYRPAAQFLEQAELIIKTAMDAYVVEQERLAAEERRRAEAIAAAERRRLAEEAEAARKAAEAEQKRLAEEAAEAQRKGDADAAAAAAAEAAIVEQNAAAQVAAIEATADVIVAPVVVAPAPTAAGISTAKTWDWEIDEEAGGKVAAIKAIASALDKDPSVADLLTIDGVKMRARVRALGKHLNIQGIRVFEKRTVRAAA